LTLSIIPGTLGLVRNEYLEVEDIAALA
jgi:hypothetical protein